MPKTETTVTDGLLEQALLDACGSENVRHVLRREERAVALRKLRNKGLVAAMRPSERGSGEYGWLQPTERGTKIAAACLALRAEEARGVDLDRWTPRRQPWAMKGAEFRDWAMLEARTSDGSTVYHSNGHMMLRGRNPDWDAERNAPATVEADTILSNQPWKIGAVHPIGYFFAGDAAHIAFDRKGLFLRADYYEIALHGVKNASGWEAFWPEPAPETEEGSDKPPRAAMVRLRTEDGETPAYIAPVWVDVKLPELDDKIRAE